MSLDINKTSVQIDGIAQALTARENNKQERIGLAIDLIKDFDLDAYRIRRAQVGQTEFLPGINEPPSISNEPPSSTNNFCVVAVDGSHIDVDRNIAARCFLINVGVSVLEYGDNPKADLYSEPKLYATDEELVIIDPATYREQVIEGAVLGAKRTVEEVKAMASTLKELPLQLPTLAMIDGPLAMIGLIPSRNQDFVLRELVEEGFGREMDHIAELGVNHSLALVGYISMPASTEIVKALRLMACTYDVQEEGFKCGIRGLGRKPCGSCVGGLMDRDVFSKILKPGQRSELFATTFTGIEEYYATDIFFFYVNVGHEIARLEVPSWVAEKPEILNLVHELVIDQCEKGNGYPVALAEAHEQAVIGGPDRRFFNHFLELALLSNGVPFYHSEKARSKRIRMM